MIMLGLSSSYGTIFHATSASQRYRNAIFTTLPMLAGRQSAAAITDKVISECGVRALGCEKFTSAVSQLSCLALPGPAWVLINYIEYACQMGR